MTKKEIQYVMKLIRPAIIALYGRQKLTLEGYEAVEVVKERLYSDFSHNNYEKIINISGWFAVKGDSRYIAKVNDGKVVSLSIGELND